MERQTQLQKEHLRRSPLTSNRNIKKARAIGCPASADTMASKSHHSFDVTFDGLLMSVRCTFDVKARVSSVAISVDIGVDTCTSKHIKSFDGGLMLDRGSRVRF